MRFHYFLSVAALLIGVSVALGQAPAGSTPVPASPDPGQLALPTAEGVEIAPAVPDASVEGECFWVGAEYLLWRFKNSPLPVPIVTTTSSADQTPTAGLGVPGTSVLLGDETLDTGMRHGGRFALGMWVDRHHDIGIEASYFAFASRTLTQSISSNGQANAAILAVPFFADDLGSESTFVLASPAGLAGSAALSLTSRLQGAELNGAVKVCPEGPLRFDVLGGFRYLALREDLRLVTTSLGIQAPDDGSNNSLVADTVDRFATHNQFYGGQVGARAEYRFGSLLIGGSVKVAVGGTYQTVNIASATATNFFNTPPGGPFTGVPVQIIPGTGVFGQATNVGRRAPQVFAVAPEVGVNVGYQLPWGVRAFVGYDFLYLSSVLRPGNQIDHTITFAQTVQNSIAGNSAADGDRPIVPLLGSSFWAQGVNFGVEWHF
jgi:hypothetical protein